MKIIQRCWLLILCGLIFSCSDEPKETPNTGKIINIDTIPTRSMAVNAYAQVDVSPMDMSYFPVDYPKIKMTNPGTGTPVVRLVYSRPHLANRKLFNDILKFDEPWRLGANESTEINFYQPVTIQNKKINPGRYIIYSIPHKDSWTIVLNSNIDTWGLKQDQSKDINRFNVPVSVGNPTLEFFTMVFEKADKGANLIIGWDDVLVKLPINF